MKRFLTSLATVAVLVTSGIPASAQVTPAAFGGQLAVADWLVRDGRGYSMYVAMVERFPTEEGVTTQAVVARGKCDRFDDGDSTVVVCSARGRSRSIPLEAFEMDPLMGFAELNLTRGGYTHTVGWIGHGILPLSGAGVAVGELGAIAGVGMGRSAGPSGKLFGRKLKAKGMAYGELSQGVTAGLFVDGGYVRVHKTYRLAK